jgi:hypothetical protein
MRLSFVGLLLLLSPLAAFSAQSGKIIADEASVYEQPDESSQVLHVFKNGELVRLSSESKSGWYKIVLPGQVPRQALEQVKEARFGWIQLKDVQSAELFHSLKGAGIEQQSVVRLDSRHFLSVTGFAGLGVTQTMPLQRNPFYGLEVAFRLNDYWYAGVRGKTVSMLSGHDVSIFGEYALIFSRPWRFGLGAGAGVLMTVSGTSSLIPAMDVRLSGRYYIYTRFGIEAETGYRYAFQRSVDFSAISAAGGVFFEF